MKKKRYSNKNIIDSAKKVYSIAQLLREIGLKPLGGNYKTIKRKLKELKIDITHFTGQGHLKGKTHNWTPRRPLEEILVKHSDYKTGNYLKKRLIKENIFDKKCSICKLTKWTDCDIPLELDHINGETTDNRIENLRLLCPNCHALTPTYRGKNIKIVPRVKDKVCGECNKKIDKYTNKSGYCISCMVREGNGRDKKRYYCIDCKKEITNKSKRCIECNSYLNRKIKNRPSKKTLLQEIKELGYRGTGRRYGVSDSCIIKWVKD